MGHDVYYAGKLITENLTKEQLEKIKNFSTIEDEDDIAYKDLGAVKYNEEESYFYIDCEGREKLYSYEYYDWKGMYVGLFASLKRFIESENIKIIDNDFLISVSEYGAENEEEHLVFYQNTKGEIEIKQVQDIVKEYLKLTNQ
jgi:hypothetical protein